MDATNTYHFSLQILLIKYTENVDSLVRIAFTSLNHDISRRFDIGKRRNTTKNYRELQMKAGFLNLRWVGLCCEQLQDYHVEN